MDTIEAIKSRRAINFFDPARTIPREKINEIITIAGMAPSSFNLQPWEVVVVTDIDRKEILKKCASNQPKVAEAPAVLIVIANPGGLEANLDRVIDNMADLGYLKPEDRDKTKKGPLTQYHSRESIERKFWAIKNTSFFAMNFMIAAKGLGYETHPMDGFSQELVKKEFHIPEDRFIPLLIALGYPREGLKLLPPKFRMDIVDFVKYEDYGG